MQNDKAPLSDPALLQPVLLVSFASRLGEESMYAGAVNEDISIRSLL